MIGTAVHAAAEKWIGEQTLNAADLGEVAVAAFRREVEINTDAVWTKYSHAEAEAEAVRLAGSWLRNLSHHVKDPVATEMQFCAPLPTGSLMIFDRPLTIWMKGTIDLVQRHNVFDWKTASASSAKKYTWRDKQLTDIQSAMYATALHTLGHLTYPVEFNFGVLVRGTNDTKVVTIHRDERHERWLVNQIIPIVRHALMLGTDMKWITNDTGALCSPDWCPAWSACKGAHLPHIPYPTRSK